MARMRLTIRGKLGTISLSSFLEVLDGSLDVLHDLDRRISEQSWGTIQWVITHLGEGSTYVEVEPRVVRGEENYTRQVLESFTDGVEQIKTKGTTPPRFSLDNLKRVRDIVRQIGKDGLEGVDYSVEEYQKETELTSEFQNKLENLIGVHHRSLGSIEGTVELVSVHKGTRHFNIYHPITQRAVRCNLPKDYESDVFRAAEGRRRVIATGRISYNLKGEPISVHIMKPLRFLKEEDSLPDIKAMVGLDHNITGDLSTEDYIRSIRE